MSDEAVYDNLPKYDPTKSNLQHGHPAQHSTLRVKTVNPSTSATSPSGFHSNDSAHDLDGDDSDEEVWEDAHDELVQQELEAGVEDSPDGLVCTVAALRVRTPFSNYYMRFTNEQKLVDRAYIVKDEGNAAFTSEPPKTELAIEKYQSALKLLPPVPKLVTPATKPSPVQSGSGIQEITDEEAEAIVHPRRKC